VDHEQTIFKAIQMYSILLFLLPSLLGPFLFWASRRTILLGLVATSIYSTDYCIALAIQVVTHDTTGWLQRQEGIVKLSVRNTITSRDEAPNRHIPSRFFVGVSAYSFSPLEIGPAGIGTKSVLSDSVNDVKFNRTIAISNESEEAVSSLTRDFSIGVRTKFTRSL
jgi:hypothetical protein